MTEDIDKISLIGSSLMRLATEQIGIRQTIEDRWLSDLEQYLGKYDAITINKLEKSKMSKAFVNGTRSKTNAAEARLSDMLFPTDDKNWGIKPTPVPEMSRFKNSEKLVVDEYGDTINDKNGQELSGREYFKEKEKDARDKAELMEKEINDQLTEANYQDICREVIHDSCLYGTGVIKAPVVINRTRKKWDKLDDDVHSLSIEKEYRPSVEHIKIWDFFPDMSSTNIDDANFVFERRFISKKQLIELAKRPGYFPKQIQRVMEDTPDSQSYSGSGYISKLRELSNLSVDLNKGKYELWEYHGELSAEDLSICGHDVDENDAMVHTEVIVVFIGSHIIKVDINPLETGDRPYSIFVYDKDDSSIFGVGVPHLVRNEQRIMNAAWRMVLDNAGISTAPQIIMNKDVVTPSDGEWDLRPRKIWFTNNPDFNVDNVFTTFNIPSHQNELYAIYLAARSMMDDVTNLPLLSQGEMGGAPDTAAGMSMLMNSSNVVLRRVVKTFDDDITTPVITRFYDWNMQNSEKEEIKGDYNVKARGSSTLLVKETQTQALMHLMQISQSPHLAPITKIAGLYRKVAESQHLAADDIIKTDEQIKEEQEQEKSPPIELLLAKAEMELKVKLEQMRNETSIAIAQIKSQTDTQINQLREDNKANLQMHEAQIKERHGQGL